LFKKGCLRILS